MPVLFMGLLLPSLVADWASGDRAAFRGHLDRAFAFFALLGFPIAAGAQVVAEPLVVFIAGPEYAPAGTILRLLMLAVLGVFFGGLYGHAVVAVNGQHRMMYGYATVAALATAGYLLCIPRFGVWGAIGVTVAAET